MKKQCALGCPPLPSNRRKIRIFAIQTLNLLPGHKKQAKGDVCQTLQSETSWVVSSKVLLSPRNLWFHDP